LDGAAYETFSLSQVADNIQIFLHKQRFIKVVLRKSVSVGPSQEKTVACMTFAVEDAETPDMVNLPL
jgi:hypothetical protein